MLGENLPREVISDSRREVLFDHNNMITTVNKLRPHHIMAFKQVQPMCQPVGGQQSHLSNSFIVGPKLPATPRLAHALCLSSFLLQTQT